MGDRAGTGTYRRASLALAPLLTLLLVAAVDSLEAARDRLRQMSPAQREEVAAVLKRFDLRLGPAEQRAIRELHQRVSSLPEEEKARYLGVLRRYHNWLSALPGPVRDNLLSRPPEQRMAEVRGLARKYPPAIPNTPLWLELGDLSGPSAFELASLFQIWRKLTPEERKAIEKAPLQQRTLRLHQVGRRTYQIPREVHPDGFDAEAWRGKAEARLNELRIQVPELKAAPSPVELAGESAAPRKGSLREQLRPFVLHRFAVNLYGLEHPPEPVRPDLLGRFLADLPPWVRSTFDNAAADEARRKLTLAYRVVFPPPNELKPVAAPGASTPRSARPGAGSQPPGPPRESKKPAGPPPGQPQSTPF